MRKRIHKYYERLAVAKAAPRADRKKVCAVLKVYQEFDAAVEKFQKLTGLRCPAGCGRCCDNPDVTVTLLEGAVVAAALERQKTLDHWLEKLKGNPGERVCVFLKKQDRSLAGKCSIYPWRPLICRGFGFSSRTDKNSLEALVTCRLIKRQKGSTCPQDQKRVEPGFFAPRVADYFRRLQGIDLPLTQQEISINQAMQSALARTGLLLVMEKGRVL